mmetsp:Transcript_15250/g.22425  ORF Transcript_15250/g.22425 Transcript_15250/m.22425 type:complete len:191 (-) Transcript_15250:379-951(-)
MDNQNSDNSYAPVEAHSTKKITEEVSVPEDVPAIDVTKEIYPNCLVWCPIPCITWTLPFVGHMGIADSRGTIYDFAGPFCIGRGHLAFGRVTRYIQLNSNMCRQLEWDEGIEHANGIYQERMHNLFCDNCHSHVATALDAVAFQGYKSWNMFILAGWMFFCGRYTSLAGLVQTWAPFVVIITIILCAKFL